MTVARRGSESRLAPPRRRPTRCASSRPRALPGPRSPATSGSTGVAALPEDSGKTQARLAVDESARGVGLGAQFLRFVLELAAKMADEVGCAGVVVDAKAGAVEFYKKYGFMPFEVIEGQSEARPRPTTMWLSMRAIKAARGATH